MSIVFIAVVLNNSYTVLFIRKGTLFKGFYVLSYYIRLIHYIFMFTLLSVGQEDARICCSLVPEWFEQLSCNGKSTGLSLM